MADLDFAVTIMHIGAASVLQMTDLLVIYSGMQWQLTACFQ